MKSVAGRDHKTARERKTWREEINVFLLRMECLDVFSGALQAHSTRRQAAVQSVRA